LRSVLSVFQAAGETKSRAQVVRVPPILQVEAFECEKKAELQISTAGLDVNLDAVVLVDE
jgi:hypothetical protein